jgi:hypothetical protein
VLTEAQVIGASVRQSSGYERLKKGGDHACREILGKAKSVAWLAVSVLSSVGSAGPLAKTPAYQGVSLLP